MISMVRLKTRSKKSLFFIQLRVGWLAREVPLPIGRGERAAHSVRTDSGLAASLMVAPDPSVPACGLTPRGGMAVSDDGKVVTGGGGEVALGETRARAASTSAGIVVEDEEVASESGWSVLASADAGVVPSWTLLMRSCTAKSSKCCGPAMWSGEPSVVEVEASSRSLSASSRSSRWIERRCTYKSTQANQVTGSMSHCKAWRMCSSMAMRSPAS
mmetsp:Transcript_5198/g.16701  ORF Transcript_5198/g.16701 Transcript_5198/m.16701 type:complete len:215 (-) Transcript_5198:172-816(-)